MGLNYLNEASAAEAVEVDLSMTRVAGNLVMTGVTGAAAELNLTVEADEGFSLTAPACRTLYVPNCPNLATLILTACTAMVSLSVDGTTVLEALTVPAALNAVTVSLPNQALDVTSVDALINALAAGTGVNGTLILDGGTTAAPNASYATGLQTLYGRGWTAAINELITLQREPVTNLTAGNTDTGVVTVTWTDPLEVVGGIHVTLYDAADDSYINDDIFPDSTELATFGGVATGLDCYVKAVNLGDGGLWENSSPVQSDNFHIDQ